MEIFEFYLCCLALNLDIEILQWKSCNLTLNTCFKDKVLGKSCFHIVWKKYQCIL